MDRFIVIANEYSQHNKKYLKSNMDRFIVVPISSISTKQSHLKSNMDRFIAIAMLVFLRVLGI